MKQSLLFSLFASASLLGNAQVHVTLAPQCANETSRATVLSAPKKANVDYFQYGFCRTGADFSSIGIQADATYRYFLQMPKEVAAKYAGDKVLGLNFGLGSLTNATAKVFVTEDFAAADADFLALETKTVTPQDWNTVNFSSPYTITGDKDLFFGVEVTAKKADWPIPSVSGVVGSEANTMFAVYGKYDSANPTEDVWAYDFLSNSGFGPCAINVVLTGDSQPTNDIALSSISLKSTIASDYAAPVNFSVFNPSVNQIDSFDVIYTLNDGEEHKVNVPCSILPNATGNYSVKLDPISEGGDYAINFSIANPNGEADTDDSNNSWTGSFSVNTEIYPRTVLVEDFTAVGCGYCPYGTFRLNNAVEGREDVIVVAHHAGPMATNVASDPMFNTDGAAYASRFNCSGNPQVMFDRTTLVSGANTPIINLGTSEEVTALINKAGAVNTRYKVEAEPTYNEETRELTVSVTTSAKGEVLASDKDVYVNVLFMENNYMYPQYSYLTMDTWQSTNAFYIPDYLHQHVSRRNIASTWGEKVEWDGNESTTSFTYTVPTDYTIENCYVVAYIANYSSTSRSNNKVLNATKAIIPQYPNSGVSTVGSKEVVNVVGAEGAILVDGNSADVKVYGIDGSLKAQSAQGGSIAVAPGLYIVKAGNTVKKVIVK